MGQYGLAKSLGIDNLAATGAVKLDGVTWTARTPEDGVTVEEGAPVIVQEIQGVKLIVVPKSEF